MCWKDNFPKENRYFENKNGILYVGDSLEIMNKIKDESIDLVVTSPPYNKMYWSKNRNIHDAFSKEGRMFARNTDYGVFHDDMTPQKYEEWQNKAISEMRRLLVKEGSLFYNHIDILHNFNTIHPTFVYNHPIKEIIIWNRKSTPKLDKHYFLPVTEWIFWIKKNYECNPYFDRQQAKFKKNVWDISPKKNEGLHPAPMNEEIPYNCIVSTTHKKDIVLDPFAGIGTTLSVAEQLNRRWIGIELNPEYCEIAKQRILAATKQTKLR